MVKAGAANAILLGVVIGLLGCGSAAPQRSSDPGQPAGEAGRDARPLTIAMRVEPFDITDSGSTRNNIGRAVFGASLVHLDRNEVPYGVLAEGVPQLNSDDWRVLPDGKMETTFHLRGGLSWHDGTPFSAQDFLFARRVNMTSVEWGLAINASPETAITEEIVAPDERTLVFRWRQPYVDAATPSLRPLPRHILGPVLDQGIPDALGSHAYWTTEFVGTGPYRLSHWEPGAFIEGSAFAGYALGKPKIERVRLTWSGDPNSTLARLLANDADVALDQAIQFEQAATLRREWAPRNGGTVILTPAQIRQLQAQHRAEVATPGVILDPRFRRATAYALDRRALADALLEGEGEAAETIAPRRVSYDDEIQRMASKYPYDLRQSEQLMAQLGFSKGADGMYVGPTGRLTPEVLGLAEGQEGQETTIVVDFLRRGGFDAQLRLVPSALINQSDEMKATFPAWRTNYTPTNRSLGAERLLGSRAAAPENRWAGTNKTGWSHPEHDRLYDAWTKALDRDERNRLIVQIARIESEELPYIPLYFNTDGIVHTTSVRGPYSPAIETTPYENIHQWERS
jgi:peptide/nickel transport system substrate-binding protein